MKTLLALFITSAALAQTTGLDVLGADTLGDAQSSTPALGTVAKVEQKVSEGAKMKCDPVHGCALFVDGGKGYEVKVSVGAGEGPNYSAGGGGINIYSGSSSEQYYGLAITFTYSNFKCTRYVPEGTYRIIETYQHLMASQEYVSKVFAAWKKGEDMPTPDAVKTALAVLATVKPSQNNCGQRLTN